MRNKNQNILRERQLKFAEAGILFVLLLGVAIFVGVRFGGDDETAVADTGAMVTDSVVVEMPMIVEDTTPVETTLAEVTPDVEPAMEAEPVPVTYETAEAAYHAGDYAEAVDLFDRYATDNPDNVWGLYMLGLSAWKAGDNDLADEALADARELRPDHLKSAVNHARVLLDMDRDVDAQAAVSAALAVDPDDPAGRRLQARLDHRAGRLEASATGYESLLREHGDDVWALNNLGLILIEQERFDEALAPLARAASLDAAACIHNNLGLALERNGRFGQAAEAFAASLEQDADHVRAAASLARVSGLTDDPSLPVLDLAAVAAGFMAESAEDPAAAEIMGEVAVAVMDESEDEFNVTATTEDPEADAEVE